MITAQKDHRGSGRCLSPSQMFDAGYRQGLNGRKDYQLYASNTDYTSGWNTGYRDRPNGLFSLPATVEAPLERGWGDELLNQQLEG